MAEDHSAQVESIRFASMHGDLHVLRSIGAEALYALRRASLAFSLAIQYRQWSVVHLLTEMSGRSGLDLCSGWRVPHLAALHGDLDVIKATPADELRTTSEMDETVLHAAVLGGQTHVAEYLITHAGLDAHAQTKLGDTALQLACGYRWLDVVDKLVKLGVDPDGDDEYARSPLQHAVNAGHVAVAQRLVALGANVDRVAAGFAPLPTALHSAASRGDRAMVECLLNLGANVNAVGNTGATPISAAARASHVQVVELLAAANADVHLGLGAPLLCAVLAPGRTDAVVSVVRVLLEYGADRSVVLRKRVLSRRRQVLHVLDSYFPITRQLALVLLSMHGPVESPLSRFASHELFDGNLMGLVKCFMDGGPNPAFDELR